MFVVAVAALFGAVSCGPDVVEEDGTVVAESPEVMWVDVVEVDVDLGRVAVSRAVDVDGKVCLAFPIVDGDQVNAQSARAIAEAMASCRSVDERSSRGATIETWGVIAGLDVSAAYGSTAAGVGAVVHSDPEAVIVVNEGVWLAVWPVRVDDFAFEISVERGFGDPLVCDFFGPGSATVDLGDCEPALLDG